MALSHLTGGSEGAALVSFGRSRAWSEGKRVASGSEIAPTALNRKLFHGTHEIPPEVAFEKGLPLGGGDTRLLQHAMQSGGSAFRGTTTQIFAPGNEAGAGFWAGDGGWVYQLDGTASWDVNASLEGRVPKPGGFEGNPMRGENEQAILAGVPRERIAGAIQIVEVNGRLVPKPIIPNPHYKPLK